MGRTNPKLIPFLKKNLEEQRFINLKYETQKCGSESIFYIELPRYDKDKCGEFENILKAWYEFNGKPNKYLSYSNGKSVFQAALKKSVYLISLPNFGKRQRYRFATTDEIKENKRRLKEKARNNLEPPSPYTVTNPPSVASSSGYSSCNDSEAENIQTVGENVQDMNMCMSDDFLDVVMKHPENYIGDVYALDDLFSDINMNDAKEEFLPPLLNINPSDVVPLQAMQSEAFDPVHLESQFMKPVTELKPTPVGNFGTEKKYWLCTQKIKVKGTLQLICEMQVLEDENSDIKEGSVVIPNCVFEGISYKLIKSFELDDLKYCFFSPNSA